MRRFIVRNHRERKKLTLTADSPRTKLHPKGSSNLSLSISLHLAGRRVIELPDRVCARYADALAAYVKRGELVPLGAAPAAPVDPLLDPEVSEDELDEDPDQDEDLEA